MNRRYANKWSASVGGGYTQMSNFPEGYPEQPERSGPRGSHHVEPQGDGVVRRAVRHPHLAGHASSVGRQLRPHDQRARRRQAMPSA